MLPAASAQTAAFVAPFSRSIEQPFAYSPIPQRLITDLHDNVLAIGLYGFIARLYLVAQTPIPLSVPDVLRYDPALSRGAVLRALARLIGGGYLLETAQPGLKTRYTPAWGRVGGAPLSWNMAQPCLGRPRHIARLRLDRRLFDICMGKLVPHATRAAAITRYITMPVVSLTDIGCYALTLAGLPRPTPALSRLGMVQEQSARPLPSDERLLALISQRALNLGEAADPAAELTISGTRKLGILPLLTPDPDAAAQPLFFVPPGMIGSLIHSMIGSMIGSNQVNICPAIAAERAKTRSVGRAEGITWESRDPGETANPPPTPAHHPASGGGGAETVVQRVARHRRSQQIQPIPNTATAAALQSINVKPAQVVELAHMPLVTVEAAITDGRARPGIRDLAGWVVSLLRTHRDYGWNITPPAPAPDSPEDLRAAFARYAAEQESALGHEPDRKEISRGSACAQDDAWRPAAATEQPEPLIRIWNNVQAAMQLRITRQEWTTWLRPSVLRSVEHGMAVVSVPSVRIKAGLERYTAPIRELLTSLLGAPIQLRVTVRGEAAMAQAHMNPAHLHVQPIDTSTPAPVPPASTPEQRPDWIQTDDWLRLPTMLRAALIGSVVVDGAVQAVSPHLSRLIVMRYAREVATLLASIAPGTNPGNGALDAPAKDLDPPRAAAINCQ